MSWWTDAAVQADREAFTRILRQKYQTLAMVPHGKAVRVKRITHADVVAANRERDRVGHGPRAKASAYNNRQRAS